MRVMAIIRILYIESSDFLAFLSFGIIVSIETMKTRKSQENKGILTRPFKKIPVGSKFKGAKVNDEVIQEYEKIQNQLDPNEKRPRVVNSKCEVKVGDKVETFYRYFAPHELVLPIK